MKEKYYITTAIAYASTKPHFGNTYEVIMTDAVARYKRLRGYDVFFCTVVNDPKAHHRIRLPKLFEAVLVKQRADPFFRIQSKILGFFFFQSIHPGISFAL